MAFQIPQSKKGWQFLILVVVLSVIPYYFILQEGGSDSPFTLLLMWIPAIAAIIMRLLHKEGLFKGICWNPLRDWKWLLIGLAVPFLIELLTLSGVLLLDAGALKSDFFAISHGEVSVKGVSMIFGAAPQSLPFFVFNYIFSFSVGVLLYGLFFTLGEEYGWRGYLQKEWAPEANLNGFIWIGVVWGLWHLPAILQGHNYPEYPVLGGFVFMPLLCTLFSICFGVAYHQRKVIWVAVVFHASLNVGTDISNVALASETVNEPIKDGIWTLLWLITALLIGYFGKKKADR
ncbi:CPBP family intramembrane glutamic endopeptidase [Croceiramulus getboli]|nr:CPBP family intramembrane metalloprotease [Flavobacteriaceae bacterium YJPT1-3]